MVVTEEAFRVKCGRGQVVLIEVELANVDQLLPLGVAEHHLHVLAFKGDLFGRLTVSCH